LSRAKYIFFPARGASGALTLGWLGAAPKSAWSTRVLYAKGLPIFVSGGLPNDPSYSIESPYCLLRNVMFFIFCMFLASPFCPIVKGVFFDESLK
jgi:hypothetical protein